tara:strand:- start:1396 stop:1863 length:468 start_codon:yes stop_codon:yes gene_type:complete
MIDINRNIKKLGLEIPAPIKPLANYAPFVRSNKLIFISGQIPIRNNVLEFSGKLGRDLNISEGKKAAELCIINTLSILKDILEGDLNKLSKCIRLSVYINSIETFYDQPAIADGASNIIKELFLENGEHTRSAVGANSLPKNAAVEIDSIFELSN